MQGVYLGDLTWPEAKAWFEAGRVIIVPIGAAAKEHGHHLPLKTDYLLAEALVKGVAEALPVVVAPVIGFGYFPAFRHYPGSQHLSPETFSALLSEILDGLIAQGARRIAIVNTGVSTEPIVQVVVREIYERKQVRIAVADIRRLGHSADALMEQDVGGHADEHETSLIMAVAPQAVHLDRAVADYGNVRAAPRTVFYLPSIFSGDPASGNDYSERGARGDPTLASAEKGRAILEASVADIVDGLRQLFPDALEAQ
jgi:creatinine amidohydrolase